jgi:hypothetical protein
MRSIVVYILRAYKIIISPVLPNACRFNPTCSEYAAQAVGRYGIIKGCWLGIRRLLKCHPYNPGGHDPVP